MKIKLEEKKPHGQQHDKLYTIVMWLLTGFMFISGVVFIPSAASATMILFSFISAPIEQPQKFYASKKLQGGIKIALLIVLFGVSVALYKVR